MSARLPDLLQKGIDLFNEGHYFECHEVLEELWRGQAGDDKQFTQGLIQAAVAVHHARKNNPKGARKLCDRALMRLRPFCPQRQQIDVAALVRDLEALRDSTDSALVLRIHRVH